jgi:hypothetical protein
MECAKCVDKLFIPSLLLFHFNSRQIISGRRETRFGNLIILLFRLWDQRERTLLIETLFGPTVSTFAESSGPLIDHPFRVAHNN